MNAHAESQDYAPFEVRSCFVGDPAELGEAEHEYFEVACWVLRNGTQ